MWHSGEELHCNQGAAPHEFHIFRLVRPNGVVSTYKRR